MKKANGVAGGPPTVPEEPARGHDASSAEETARKESPMDGASISALAARTGSIIGGVTALGTSWLTQQAQARARENAEERAARETLYSDFIAEASRLCGDAWANDKAEISNLIGLYPSPERRGPRPAW
jgi:hypothetical protein